MTQLLPSVILVMTSQNGFIIIAIDCSSELGLLFLLVGHHILDYVLPFCVNNKYVGSHSIVVVIAVFDYIMNFGLVLLLFSLGKL